MRISAKFSAEHAATEEEQSRVHASGPYAGFFFVSRYIQTASRKNENGSRDYTEAYTDALRQFLAEEPRVGEGHAFEVLITA